MTYHNQPQRICENCGGIKTVTHRTNAKGICYNIRKSPRNSRRGKVYYPHIMKSHRATNVDKETLADSLRKLFGLKDTKVKTAPTKTIHADRKPDQ
jgi:hypothetical protein